MVQGLVGLEWRPSLYPNLPLADTRDSSDVSVVCCTVEYPKCSIVLTLDTDRLLEAPSFSLVRSRSPKRPFAFVRFLPLPQLVFCSLNKHDYRIAQAGLNTTSYTGSLELDCSP